MAKKRPTPDAYLKPYRDHVDQHGATFAATLWASRESQQLRFAAMNRSIHFAGKRVLDAGCSRGDFAEFLLAQDIQYKHYIGIDGVDEVIDFAQRQNIPRSEFHVGDLVAHAKLFEIGDPQIITISGTLNTMTDDQVHRLLASAWKATSETLAFNFLSDQCGPGASPQAYPARRLDTLTWLRWAFKKTHHVVFRQDYFPHGHDAMIIMRKPSAI